MSRRKRKLVFFFSYLLVFCLYSPQICTAKDTISSTQTVTDGETLISKGEVFELGFFSLTNSSKRYIGLWYKKNPDRKIVWVANRDNPLLDTSGVLKIGGDGNIVLLDGTQNVVWSTNVSFGSNNSLAMLLDEGNLVLIRSPLDVNNYIWQSFDHPTDTLLQGMKLGVNTRTGERYDLTSWKAQDDPSPGNYSLGIGRLELPQLLIWKQSLPYWRSGEWNGSQFIGIPDMQSTYVNGTQLISDGGVYFSFSVFQNGDIYIRTLNSSGVLKEMIWYNGGTGWKERGKGNWWPPKDQCDIYGTCGPFGSCNMDNSPNICRCLQGFEPRFIEEWNEGNWTGGCARRTQLQCERNRTSVDKGKEDGFAKLEGLKLPDYSNFQIFNENQCLDECAKNCSCLAYAIVKGIGCLVWGGNLVDIRKFPFGGQELFLRLAYSELGGKKPLKIYVIVLIAGSIFVGVLACILCTLKIKQRAVKKKISVQRSNSSQIIHASSESGLFSLSKDREMERDRLELPSFDFDTVVVATNNFLNKLGEGGFGPVYKGKLPDGVEIAVKRLASTSGQGVEEFKNELKLISKLQHRNLVRLLGFCVEREEKILLYEYMPHRSLDAFLFDSTRRVLLDWGTRFNIIDGVARGLLYLHRDSRLKVIHRDLKVSNILLDEEMNPKISDFGMARIFGGKQILANTNRVVGTYGYMSPEYAMEGIFSEKSDVFSFGVLMLEIVTGKRNSSFCLLEQSSNLLGHAWRLWNEDKVLELMDPTLVKSYRWQEVMRCIHMALLCVQEHAIDRPTMSTIVSMLGSGAILPNPRQPAFTLERKYVPSDDPSHSSDAIPTYNGHTTTVQAR